MSYVNVPLRLGGAKCPTECRVAVVGVGLGGTAIPPRSLAAISPSLLQRDIAETNCLALRRARRANNLYGIPATAAQNCTCRALFPTEIVSPSFVVLGLMLHVKGTHPPYPLQSTGRGGVGIFDPMLLYFMSLIHKGTLGMLFINCC